MQPIPAAVAARISASDRRCKNCNGLTVLGYNTCECIDDGTLREVFPIDYLVMGGVVFSAAVIVIIIITTVTTLKHPRTAAGRYFTARQFPCF